LQPDAGIPTFYMLIFAPPYELLDGILTNDHQPSAFDTSGSMHENTRLRIAQEISHHSFLLEDILTSCRGVTCFCTTAPSWTRPPHSRCFWSHTTTHHIR